MFIVDALPAAPWRTHWGPYEHDRLFFADFAQGFVSLALAVKVPRLTVLWIGAREIQSKSGRQSQFRHRCDRLGHSGRRIDLRDDLPRGCPLLASVGLHITSEVPYVHDELGVVERIDVHIVPRCRCSRNIRCSDGHWDVLHRVFHGRAPLRDWNPSWSFPR